MAMDKRIGRARKSGVAVFVLSLICPSVESMLTDQDLQNTMLTSILQGLRAVSGLFQTRSHA
jgi:hypothetical protein